MPPTAPPGPTPAPPPRRRRWAWVLARVVEVGTIAVALGALLLWCSVPRHGAARDGEPDQHRVHRSAARRRRRTRGAVRPEWQWRPLGKISRYLRAAVIYAEDYNFYRHDGVDWDAIEDAVDVEPGTRAALAIGGSTITQQLAKNLYLSPSRSILRKAARAADRVLARGPPHEAAHPRALPERRRVGRRRVRRRGRRAPLVRTLGADAVARPRPCASRSPCPTRSSARRTSATPS